MSKRNGLKKQLVNHPEYIKRLNEIALKPVILISITNYCNFKCSYCSTKKSEKKPLYMGLELLRSILKSCKDWKIIPTFGATYEPFLHPKITTIIEMVNQHGFIFRSNTNGSLLHRKVHDFPMDLIISLSENAGDFKFRNAKITSEKYKENLKSFIQSRIKNNVSGHITFQFADYEILESEKIGYDKHIHKPDFIAAKMERFANYLGFNFRRQDELLRKSIEKRQSMTVFDTGACKVSFLSTKIMPNTFEAFANNLIKMPSAQTGYCDACFTMMSIQADGGIAYCCADPTAKTVFHKLSPDEDLKTLWSSEKFNKLRDKFRSFNPPHPFCLQCLYPVSEHIKPLLTICDKRTVSNILSEYGVEENLPWFQFEEN